MNYVIDYIGIVRTSSNELSVYFHMAECEMEDQILSVTLEYEIDKDNWDLALLSHQFEESCPVCGCIGETCLLDEPRKNLLLEYLLDFLQEHVFEFTYDMKKELK